MSDGLRTEGPMFLRSKKLTSKGSTLVVVGMLGWLALVMLVSISSGLVVIWFVAGGHWVGG